MFCSKCGKQANANDMFCRGCGSQFNTVPQTPPEKFRPARGGHELSPRDSSESLRFTAREVSRWEIIKKYIFRAYGFIVAMNFIVVPWGTYKNNSWYGNSYRLIFQPPEPIHKNYNVSINFEEILGHIILFTIAFGVIYFVAKKITDESP